MKFGVAIFFTDYSIKPTTLARALEERGFDSLWCPEHSHIPISRVEITRDHMEISGRYIHHHCGVGACSPAVGDIKTARDRCDSIKWSQTALYAAWLHMRCPQGHVCTSGTPCRA